MRTKSATIVAGLGFGDEGKGSIVDYLARTQAVSAVIRFNGGGQAAHNVRTSEGQHHTFNQFGSATFVPGVRTHLSRFMLVDPLALIEENKRLQEQGVRGAFDRLTVDREAIVVTTFHKMANRIRELSRGDKGHGTCGSGIGETMLADLNRPELTIRVKDLSDLDMLIRKMKAVQEYLQGEMHLLRSSWKKQDDRERRLSHLGAQATLYLPDIAEVESDYLWRYSRSFTTVGGEYLTELANEGSLIFEGAQGVLLDEWFGFHPHTTWSTTTFENPLTLLQEMQYDGKVEKLGVLRAYMTRHGAGPFPTEDVGLSRKISEDDNSDTGWSGKFRMGWFDTILARYALDVVGGVDSIALTNLDKLVSLPEWFACTHYSHSKPLTERELQVAQVVEMEGDRLELDGLRPKTAREDLVYQEALTSLLQKVEPCYGLQEPINVLIQGQKRTLGNGHAIVDSIERHLDVPVSIVSHGPKAEDKIALSRMS